MSSHVEWSPAADAFVELAHAGAELGDGIVGLDDTVGTDPQDWPHAPDPHTFAICLGDAGAFHVIEGTAGDLFAFAGRVANAAAAAMREEEEQVSAPEPFEGPVIAEREPWEESAALVTETRRERRERLEYEALTDVERAAYDYHGQRGHSHAECMTAARGGDGPYCERAECGNPLTLDDIGAGDGLCSFCAERADVEPVEPDPAAVLARVREILTLTDWSGVMYDGDALQALAEAVGVPDLTD